MVADVENEYKKCPDVKKEEVLKLMEWCKRQPHLPNLTELEIIIYFHSCYNSFAMTQSCIDTSFTIRTHCPDMFSNRDVLDKNIQAQMKLVLFTPLPGLTPDGYKPIYLKVLDPDTSTFSYADTIKLFIMVIDLCVMDHGTANGYAIVLDMHNFTFMHMAKVVVSALKTFLLYLQEGLPVRLKAFHFVNTVSFMDKVMGLFRPFTKKELMDMFQLHTTPESFKRFVFPEQIPNEYGGTAGTFRELQEKSNKHMMENRDFFLKEQAERRVNEKLRPGKPKGASDVFGVEGNFKKLDLD